MSELQKKAVIDKILFEQLITKCQINELYGS